jgi:hypothetical protein
METETNKAFTSAQDRAPVKIDLSGAGGLAGSMTDDSLRFLFCNAIASVPSPPQRNAPWKTNA